MIQFVVGVWFVFSVALPLSSMAAEMQGIDQPNGQSMETKIEMSISFRGTDQPNG
jgi:hypothetical protein